MNTSVSSQDSHSPHNQSTLTLAIAAVGVVFGDIGTSPLYAMKEAFGESYGLPPTEANILGILSMMFWALTLVVTIKYVMVVMRADNKGEGGIMALMALAQRCLPIGSEAGYVIGILGVFGAALFFGDAVITPAISVLSAVEGLKVAAPGLEQYVLPITVGVIFALFLIQKQGTEKVSTWFGPITCVWFIILAIAGLWGIIGSPRVLAAINPAHAWYFFTHHDWHGFLVLGAVVLAVTGAEALYADMGHFGKKPIQYAWLWFVFPALVLNYFGQGALLLESPAAIENPFYRLIPGWGLYPMIGLATAATVIASQAVISGAFSVARQAMQLGYLPRLEICHTSENTIGQVYIPWVNRMLMVVVLLLVIGFGSSSALASAYGVAVTGTMLISSLLLFVVVRNRWQASGAWVSFAFIGLLTIDIAFFTSNVVKLTDGAWLPFALGIVVFTAMRTWRRGRALMHESLRHNKFTLAHFIRSLEEKMPVRVSGTAIFMTSANDVVPEALLHNLKHNKVLHACNILLTVETVQTPRAEDDERCSINQLEEGFYQVTLRFGFMEDPNVPRALPLCTEHNLEIDLMDTTFFASRDTIVASAHKGMPIWRDKLFAFMLRNTFSATNFFRIPGNRLVELGTQVEI